MESKPSEIYVMNTNGSNEKNLTRNPADDWARTGRAAEGEAAAAVTMGQSGGSPLRGEAS